MTWGVPLLVSYHFAFSYCSCGSQGRNTEVVKQEMARVNVDILGISELKWTGMGEFNSDDITSKYCISDSFVDHDSYSISSEGFLPA